MARRAQSIGKFVGIVQVSVSSLTSTISSHILSQYSDDTHLVLKIRNFYKKLPLHMGMRANRVIDVKLIGISSTSAYAPTIDDSYVGYDDAGEVVGNGDFYGSTNPPTYVTVSNNSSSYGGDTDSYLFVPREHTNGVLPAPGEGVTSTNMCRFYLAVDFVDGSSIATLIEMRQAPAIEVNFGDINRVQVGSNASNWMQMSTNLHPDAGYSSNCTINSLYSFGKWTNNDTAQNQDLEYIYGPGNTFQPWALPVYVAYDTGSIETANDLIAYTPLTTQSNNKNTTALRWVTGKSSHAASNTTYGGNVLLSLRTGDGGEYADQGLINLGQFFEMDRIDSPTYSGSIATSSPTGAANANTKLAASVNTDTPFISYGRRFGSINYFSKNQSKATAGAFEFYPLTTAGQPNVSVEGGNGARIGLGPTMGLTMDAYATDKTPVDLTTNASNCASTRYSPITTSQVINGYNLYNLETVADMGSVSHPAGLRCIAGYRGGNVWGETHDAGNLTIQKYVTDVKDLKSNFFDQGGDYKAGTPIIVTARQLILGDSYTAAEIDTAAYEMLSTPSNASGATDANYFSRLNAYSDDHRGAYTLSWNSVANTTTFTNPNTCQTCAKNIFYNSAGQGVYPPTIITARQFSSLPFNGLELMANWLMGGTGSIGIPKITPDRTYLYSTDSSVKSLGGLTAGLLSILGTETPTTIGIGGGIVTHDGTVLGLGDYTVAVGDAIYPAGKPQIKLAGYQDVVFIVSMGNTTRTNTTQVSGTITDFTKNIPWFGADAFMATFSRDYDNAAASSGGNYTECGGPSGTYYIASDSACGNPDSGPGRARMLSYRNQETDYIIGSIVGIFHPMQAFADPSACYVCTDPELAQGRANISEGVVSTGITLNNGGNGYTAASVSPYINNGHSAQFRFTGTVGPNNLVSPAEACSWQITGGVNISYFQVEVTDDAGGFGYAANNTTEGFQGLRIKGIVRYQNFLTGNSAATLTTPSGQKATDVLSEILNIWTIKIIPGNASDDNAVFNLAQIVSPNIDPTDIEYAEIVELSPTQYELRFTFRNAENFLQLNDIPQVFPDLPFKRALPLRNDSTGMINSLYATFNYGATGNDNELGNITIDSFRSAFFNEQFGSVSTRSASSDRCTTYFAADLGDTYEPKAFSPRRATKVVVHPTDPSISDFVLVKEVVTYGRFANTQGCTDPDALNYNPVAIDDDGTCIDPVEGCTNAAASNYNPDANVDDGSCEFCTSNFTGLNSETDKDNFNDTYISNLINGSGENAILSTCMGMKFGKWENTSISTASNVLGILNENRASDLNGISFSAAFQGTLDFNSYPWIESLENVGVYIAGTNIPFTIATNDNDLGLSMVLGSTLVGTVSDDALSVIEDTNSHILKVYDATESVISYIMDNNNNNGGSGTATPQTILANVFISNGFANGIPGYNLTSQQSALEASGTATPLFTINGASEVLAVDNGADVRVPRFKFSGTGAQTSVGLYNGRLYVAEYVLIDPTCPEVTKYTAMYGFFMIGHCGCTIFGNQNAPSLYDWQTAGVSTLPAAYNGFDACTTNYVEVGNSPEGDEGSLCFTVDDELTSCDGLYQQCILNPFTRCVEEGITSLDDPQIIQQGGNYYYPQETTVTVRIDGIWNPTTNIYEINPALSYTITPVINGLQDQSLVQDSTDAVPVIANNVTIGLDHNFVFGTIDSYGFIITYTNPSGGIYSDIGIGSPTCVITLPAITVNNDCLINVGCTDPDAINFDPNATFDDGSCEQQDCEQIFIETVGGFTDTLVTATNTSSECTTITTTVLGVEVTSQYTQVNSTGTINVNVIVDLAAEEFPAEQCYIVITPANTTGLVGVSGYGDLLNLVISNWATTTVDGGQIDLGSGASALVSPLQYLDVLYTASANPTDYTNRNYNGDVTDESGYTFGNLSNGLYFIFVIPPPDLLDGLSEYYAANCATQTIFYLDQIATTTVGVDAPSTGNCQEDCSNPLGCEDEVYGCTDPENDNYNPAATVDDGSCAIDDPCPPGSQDPDCVDCETEFAVRLLSGDIRRRIDDGSQDPCDPTEEGDGCTDPNACNYDPLIDTSNSNNQLCDYCSCQPDSIDCCEGEDCGCDPELDENCPPPPPPECPDPANPDCNPGPPQPCYIPEECPPPPPPCVILANCPPPPPPPPPPKPPVIEVVNPVSVTCEPSFIGEELWNDIQYAAMACASNEGAKMVVKLKHGIEFDEEDLIKLDLVTYLFNGGADNSELPCLFNCNYDTRTVFEKYTAKEKWFQGGAKKWASTDSYKKGTIVAYFYNRHGRTNISYFTAMRDIFPGEIHPIYKLSGWKQVVDRKPKTKDPLGTATGTETYLEDMYNYFKRFCTACEIQEAPAARKNTGTTDDRRNSFGISKSPNRPSSQTGIIGPDGEEIIF